MLTGKNVVVGVCSSIACYKVIELVRKLRFLGANVDVIMTKNAAKLVAPKEFERASNNKVGVGLFDPKVDYRHYLKKDKPIRHISLADKAGLFLIVPATANVIGKIANGIADDLLTTSVMATKAKVAICPAMNVKMWLNQIVQRNVSELRKYGYYFIEPEHGILACGYEGVGRLADLNRILDNVKDILNPDLIGKRILVTAGATVEEIDPVRYISNHSSGKMGIALADEAHKRGADVTLIHGDIKVKPGFDYKTVKVSSVNEMFGAIHKEVKKNDVMIHCAAVSDFSVDKNKNKIKSGKKINLELKPTVKILNEIKKINKNICLIGFKAEHNVSGKELINRAYSTLKDSGSDIIVANDVGKVGFGNEKNECILVFKDKNIKKLDLNSKRIIANKILDEVKTSI